MSAWVCRGSSSLSFRWPGLRVRHYPWSYRHPAGLLAAHCSTQRSRVSTNQRDTELPKWCQWSNFKCCEIEDERYQCPPRGESCLKRKQHLFRSALQAPHSWFGSPSEFQSLLVQGPTQAAEWSSIHSQYIVVGGLPESVVSRHSLFENSVQSTLVLQGQDVLSIC